MTHGGGLASSCLYAEVIDGGVSETLRISPLSDDTAIVIDPPYVTGLASIGDTIAYKRTATGARIHCLLSAAPRSTFSVIVEKVAPEVEHAMARFERFGAIVATRDPDLYAIVAPSAFHRSVQDLLSGLERAGIASVSCLIDRRGMRPWGAAPLPLKP